MVEISAERLEQWNEHRLRRVRNFIQKHIPSARHFVEGESKRISPKRYWKSPVIIYTGTNGKREYVVPDSWFRSVVGEALRYYFDSLVEYGFLNGDGFVTRDLVERVGRVLVASIKPKILKYRTRAEQQEDRQLMEESIISVRDYVKRHENDARELALQHDQRLSKRHLTEAPLLAYFRRDKVHEFILSKRRFRREFSSEAVPAKEVLEHLRAADLLNVTDDDELYVWRKFTKPLGWERVVSIKPAIRAYWRAGD